MNVFFRPTDGFVGDVIPFYWQGQYHAFYLKAPLPPDRNDADGAPYAHLVSQDLVNWEEWPLAITPGPPGSPDQMSCFTGSVIERNGIFHIFYTGYAGPDKPQTVCRATSSDLRTWTKDPRNPIIEADPRWYEAIDWRDPFPFWNEDAGEYWMLLAAREKDGPANRRGCIALMTSPDLDQWEVRPPFWPPRLYYTHECPDLFRWGDNWVLVYSTFSERHVTHYRVSNSLNGPWLAPTNDTFDERAFYAAKTAGDGNRRFVFGWNPTRENEEDTGKWQWGGDMVVHELHRLADDGFRVTAPSELEAMFSHPEALTFQPHFGKWQASEDSYVVQADDHFAACTLGELPDSCLIQGSIVCSSQTRSCGILLRSDPELEHYYQVRWEPGRNRVVFDRWPRPGDQPFMLERPLDLVGEEQLQLKIFVDGSIVVVYINDSLALNCRGYDHRSGQLGLFVSEGGATFDHVSLKSLPPGKRI
jgi:beta-fructofuranosidase